MNDFTASVITLDWTKVITEGYSLLNLPEKASWDMGLLGRSWENIFANGLIWAFRDGAGGGTTESELI